MTEPIQSYARVGLVHFMAYKACMGGEGPILESLEKIAQDPYFQAVEVTRVNDPEIRSRAVDLLETAHLDVAFGAQPILLGNQLQAIDAVKGGIDQAAEFGAQGVGLLSGPDPGAPGRDQASDLLVDSLKRLCDYAGPKNMNVVLETFDRVPYGKNRLVGPNALAVAVSLDVRKDHANFGLMLDLSHLPLQGESPAYALGLARAHLVHAHIGNCVMKNAEHPAYGDNHPRFGCEDGENDVVELAEFLDELLNIGYLDPKKRPTLSFEVAPMEGESTETVVANAKRTLDAAWNLV